MRPSITVKAALVFLLLIPTAAPAYAEPLPPAETEKLKELICRGFGGMARDAMQAKLDGNSQQETVQTLQARFLPAATNDYTREIFQKRIENIVGRTFHLMRDMSGDILPASEHPKLAHDYGMLEYQECMKNLVPHSRNSGQ